MVLRLNFRVTHEEKPYLYFDSGTHNMCYPSIFVVFWHNLLPRNHKLNDYHYTVLFITLPRTLHVSSVM